MEKKDQWNIGYWIVAILLLLMLQGYWQTTQTIEPVPYSEFEKALAEGRVAEVLVSDRTVTGRLKSPDSRGKTTIVATRVEPDLADRLSKYGVPYARVVESTWLRDILSWILPAVVFFGVWFFLFRRFAEKQGMGGFLSIGKSRAKVFMEKNTGVTFADVAGVDEAKADTPVPHYVPSGIVNAFATGSRRHASIALTDGLLRSLSIRELQAVLAHEVAHIAQDDLRVMGLADSISRLTSLLALLGQITLPDQYAGAAGRCRRN